eukprot:984402-Amphidinium_carterae.1
MSRPSHPFSSKGNTVKHVINEIEVAKHEKPTTEVNRNRYALRNLSPRVGGSVSHMRSHNSATDGIGTFIADVKGDRPTSMQNANCAGVLVKEALLYLEHHTATGSRVDQLLGNKLIVRCGQPNAITLFVVALNGNGNMCSNSKRSEVF